MKLIVISSAVLAPFYAYATPLRHRERAFSKDACGEVDTQQLELAPQDECGSGLAREGGVSVDINID